MTSEEQPLPDRPPHDSKPETGLIAKLVRAIGNRNRAMGPRGRRILLYAASAAFVAAFAFGLASLPRIGKPIRWPMFVLSGVVGAPSILALLAAEYEASARLVGHFRVPLRDALRVSILSTAANLLPVPGSPIVRTAALQRLGTPLRGAVASTAIIGMAWVATGALLIGVLFLIGSEEVLGFALGGGGALGLVATYIFVRRNRPSRGANALFVRIFVIEAAFVAVGSLRFYLVLRGLGESPSIRQAAALTISGMIASVTGVFPGGLGIRELAAGAIGPLVGLPLSVGVVAASIVRLADLAVMAPVTFVFLRRLDKRPLVT